jgi:hypothetical protein
VCGGCFVGGYAVGWKGGTPLVAWGIVISVTICSCAPRHPSRDNPGNVPSATGNTKVNRKLTKPRHLPHFPKPTASTQPFTAAHSCYRIAYKFYFSWNFQPFSRHP